MENDFGRKLKKRRNDKNMTQEKLSEQCEVNSSTIRAWERGNQLPNAYYLKKLCIALCVSSDYMLGLKMRTRKRS